MKTKIIAVAQVKGGSGRSTLATTLAGELSKRGDTVLIDCDMPQGTSASWYAMRLEAGRTGKLHLDTADSHLDAMQKTELHTGKTQFIVLDGPPRIAELTRAMVLLADLVLVPAGASMADLWATGDVLASDLTVSGPGTQSGVVALGQTLAAFFRTMLWLNPSDNQGARFNLADVEAGRTWKDSAA